MGFATALSGLAAASTNLQVIGNNIANANTTGFKESRAEFADVYNSTGKTTPGAGVRVTEVAQQFSQGNVESTQNNLDLALSGNGFFALGERSDSTSTTAYTRNGAFHLSPDGFITNDTGNFLMGGTPIGTTVGEGFNTGAPTALRIDTSQGAPSATTTVDLKVNLDSREGRPVSPFVGYDSTVSNGPNVDTYNSSTSATIFDSLGNTHTLSTYFVDETPDGAASSTWGAYVYLDGKGLNTGTPTTLDGPGGAISSDISAIATTDATVIAAVDASAVADATAALTNATELGVISTAAAATSMAAIAHGATSPAVGADEAKDKVDAAALSFAALKITIDAAVALPAYDAVTDMDPVKAAATAATAAADDSLITATALRDEAATALDLDQANADLIAASTAAIAAFDSATDTKAAALAVEAALIAIDIEAASGTVTLGSVQTEAGTADGVVLTSTTAADDANTKAGQATTPAADAATSTLVATTAAIDADTDAADKATLEAEAAAAAIVDITDITTAAIAAANAEALLPTATAASVIAAAVAVDFVGNKIPMTFDSLGNLVADTTGTNATGANGVDDFVFTGIVIAPVDALNISAEPLSFSINPTGATQYAADFGVNDLQQNGYASGNLTGVSVNKTGVVLARYSNGTTSPLGQVILGRFTNNQGLGKIGDTTWQESIDSGTVVLGVAGGNNFGDITSSALENSNTDIATQLVRMIVAQQAYQANAQTISTEDEVIQRILQL